MEETRNTYLGEFRGPESVGRIAGRISELAKEEVRLMEVCGGHTHAIHSNGLPGLLPPQVRLLSGPGCPVCVTGQDFIDKAIALGRLQDVILATYGDLIRIPGSYTSLEREMQGGTDIRIVYSVQDVLEIARTHPDQQIIFLAIGFETTAPSTAAAIIQAEESRLENFSVLSAHKIMRPALEALAGSETRVDGFIAPGHVTAITGLGIYQDLVKKYRKAVVVSGFEPADVMQSILMLVEQITSGALKVENQYRRVVRDEGNARAQDLLSRVFTPGDAEWRGLGVIPGSGLVVSCKYAAFAADQRFRVRVTSAPPPAGCICGEILNGQKTPKECPLFSTACTPENPVGACMVSGEGACSIFYRYQV
jgi:hydrogenase expression/formation protein HypD